MHIFLALTLLVFPLLALFIAYLALSSCLGDSFRARIAGFPINPRRAVYDQNYLRTMTNPSTMSEQIELQDILHESRDDDYD
ncbi:hypothetical protein MMC30_009085 [Trapelia coarctata]|nr:hypothetical protein [Trapelia coarctata]